MTKQEFFNLLGNLDQAGQQEIDQLENALKDFSYFQIAPILQAKIASRINSFDKSKYVTKAALYTADRANLKRIIEDKVILAQPHIEEDRQPELIPVSKEEIKAVDIQKIVEEIKRPEPSPSDELYKEVMKNLETLKSLRKKYEFLEEKELHEKDTKAPVKEKKTSGSKSIPKSSSTKKTKAKDSEENDAQDTGEEKQKKINKNEQDSIIESFIKNETQFSQKKVDAEITNENDLSEHSTTINDEIFSENLAEIMLKQGKTEKAIEIYRKLIWKFPQKKAYFASRIEDLNNK